MIVLSLFDGISCARLALDRAGIQVDKYFASEIDKYAIQIASKNYPDTVQVGSVTNLFYAKDYDFLNIEDGTLKTPKNIDGGFDLFIGGSPCQDLSIAKKDRKGLDGERSSLFWEYVRILKETKPKYFVLENVASMSKESKEIITNALLEVYPDTVCHMINASLVSAQNRKRLFRTNIQGIEQPHDRGILLKDILEDDVDEKYYVDVASLKKQVKVSEYSSFDYYNDREVSNHKAKVLGTNPQSITAVAGQVVRAGQIGAGGQGDRIYSTEGKSTTLSAHGGGRGAKTGLYVENKSIRKLTPTECERLQGVPDGYTEGASNTQRYKCLGNAFNVDVVAHILSYIKKGK